MSGPVARRHDLFSNQSSSGYWMSISSSVFLNMLEYLVVHVKCLNYFFLFFVLIFFI